MGSVKGKAIIPVDQKLHQACVDLRDHVEHMGKRADSIDERYKIYTVTVDGVVIGYKIKESSPLLIDPYFTRFAWIKTPDYRLDSLKASELAAIKTAVLGAFFEPQQGEINVKILTPESMMLSQTFMIAMIQRGNERFSNRDMLDKGLVIN